MDKSKARIYDDLMVRHWDYWDEGEHLHIFVGDFGADGLKPGVDIIGADAAWDAPLAPYFDMAEIAWNHAGTMLAYTCKPLTGTAYAVSTDSDIFVYDVASGQTQNICKPTNFNTGEKIERLRDNLPGYDKYPVWSPDDRKIAFLSQRRAGNESDKARLFLYDCATTEMCDLTEDFDYNAMNVVWEGNDRLWFVAPIEATHQICRIALGEGEVEVLTKGDHDITAFTMAAGRIVAELATISSATEFYEVNPADGALTKISSINGAIYEHIRMGQVQKRWVETTDGKQMLTWVILPPDFDPARKYPTLLYCEGGPQSVVSNGWSYRWNFQLMAAQGYVVVAPNRRGVPSFGHEWLDQISGDYSGQNIRDYLSAIDDVAREPWADETRMGCVGASYGGYSVYFLAGHHQKRFKAFIAHCGIFDFDSMYGETEELFFINNDYGGPYWDKENATAMRSYANSRGPLGHADPDHHGRARLPHPLHAVARGLHGRPRAGHSGAPARVPGRGPSGLQTAELDGLEPRIFRLARQVRQTGRMTFGKVSPTFRTRKTCPSRQVFPFPTGFRNGGFMMKNPGFVDFIFFSPPATLFLQRS